VSGNFLSPPQPAGDRFAERRSVPRYSMVAEVEVFDPIQQTRFTARTVEIGANGCYVRVDTPLQRNTVIQVQIKRDGGTFKSWGRVAHAQEGSGMGIAFFRPEPNHEKTLRGWIVDLETEEKRRVTDQVPVQKI